MNQKIPITGIVNLIKTGIRYNKKTVTVPKSNWDFIELILSKIKLEIPK